MSLNRFSRRTLLRASLAASALGGLAACTPSGRHIWNPAAEPVVDAPPNAAFRDADGVAMWRQDFARLVADDAHDLLILGEIHDNPEHHQVQAWLVSMLDQTRRPVDPGRGQNGVAGLAFEMIAPDQEPEIRRFREIRRARDVADLAPLGEALAWEARGWPAWEMYAPIFLAAPTAVVTGGAVAPDALRSGAAAGAGAWPEAARLGLDQALAPAEAALRAQGQIAAHCDLLPAEAAPMLVDAQRIRDASFADALLRAQAAGGGFSVLITGNGHARTDWGAPRLLARQAPEARVLSIGLLEAPAGADPARIPLAALGADWGRARPPFDLVVVTPERARPDPCDAMRARMAPQN